MDRCQNGMLRQLTRGQRQGAAPRRCFAPVPTADGPRRFMSRRAGRWRLIRSLAAAVGIPPVTANQLNWPVSREAGLLSHHDSSRDSNGRLLRLRTKRMQIRADRFAPRGDFDPANRNPGSTTDFQLFFLTTTWIVRRW